MPRLKPSDFGTATHGRLSRRDAAAYLGFSVRTLEDWTLKGIGPKSIVLGHRRFYRLTDLQGWIRSQERIKA